MNDHTTDSDPSEGAGTPEAPAPLARAAGEGPGVRAPDDDADDLPPVAGVRFIEAGPISYCSPGDLQLGPGDYVVVRQDGGERLGWVVLAPDQVLAGRPPGPLRVIDRIATEADIRAWQQQRERAQEDLGRAQALAARSDPRLRVAHLGYDLAGARGEIMFTAPERVDVRWLEQQLTDLLGARITAAQVGDRDRAKAAGGFGLCGRDLCCSTWMTEFPAISIRLAKEQDLPPNPTKISGVCGRLLCCLAFEVDAYRELRGDLPKTGKRVTTPAGRAKVLSVNALRQVVRLRFDDTGEIVEIAADELRAQFGTAVRPEELEPIVEEPARRRDRRNRDTMVATIEPVTAPPAVIDLELDSDADVPGDEADAASDATEAEGPARRRRRGRRGGRGRRRDATAGTADAEATALDPTDPGLAGAAEAGHD
jgi:cell fate regulator YaaT (PSP1 superfamily)